MESHHSDMIPSNAIANNIEVRNMSQTEVKHGHLETQNTEARPIPATQAAIFLSVVLFSVLGSCKKKKDGGKQLMQI